MGVKPGPAVAGRTYNPHITSYPTVELDEIRQVTDFLSSSPNRFKRFWGGKSRWNGKRAALTLDCGNSRLAQPLEEMSKQVEEKKPTAAARPARSPSLYSSPKKDHA